LFRKSDESSMHRLPAAVVYSLGLFLAIPIAGCESLQTDSFADRIVLTSALTSPGEPGLMDAIRRSLAAESWRLNHVWSAELEWKGRQGGFPQPKSHRWTFGKEWDPAADKKEETSPRNSATTPPASSAPTSGPTPSAKAGSSAKSEKPSGKEEGNASASTSGRGTDGKGATSEKQSSNEPSPHWDGFWPLTVSDLIRRDDGTAASSSSKVSGPQNAGIRCLKRLAHSNTLAGWNASILLAQYDPASAVEVSAVIERLVVKPPHYVTDTGHRLNSDDSAKRTPSAASSGSKHPPADQAAASSSDASAKKTDSAREVRPTQGPKTISLAMRCAAAEAWCLVLAASKPDPVDGLAPAGRLLERPELPNEIRAELFRGVARWIRPAAIPRLDNALREGQSKARAPVEIRRAAIEACLVHAVWHNGATDGTANGATSQESGAVWPSNVMSCRLDPDLQVRATFVTWLGFARPPEAFELLKSRADSGEVGLRQAVLESLGKLHTEEARQELRAQATKSREALRASAVHGLATWGLEEVVSFAHDKWPAVRAAVTEELAKQPTLDSAVLLTMLVVDRDASVQIAAIRATKGWPDTLAFPLLLQAMRDSSAKARFEAAEQLSARHKVTTVYRFDSSPADREKSVNAVAAEVGSSLSYLDQVLHREPQTATRVDDLRAGEIRAHLTTLIESPGDSTAATKALEWLEGIGKRDVPIVEAYLQSPTRAQTDAIYHEVLPKVSPAYAALVELENPDVGVRRRGARSLAERGRGATLSRCLLLRLRQVLTHETDEPVWRSVLASIASDSTEECAEIANLSLHNKLPEVREMGCEYFARHGQPSVALLLLELLEDRDRTVQLAAIRALGSCGDQVAVRGVSTPRSHRPPPNLRSLLTSPDQTVRFTAAVSLCQLGAPEGMQELVRLSYHSNPKIREQAVKEMGLSGQTRFVGHLVTLGWTEQNGQVLRTVLESLDLLVPPENRPAELGAASATDAKIKCWAKWWQARQGAPARNLESGTPLASPPERAS